MADQNSGKKIVPQYIKDLRAIFNNCWMKKGVEDSTRVLEWLNFTVQDLSIHELDVYDSYERLNAVREANDEVFQSMLKQQVDPKKVHPMIQEKLASVGVDFEIPAELVEAA